MDIALERDTDSPAHLVEQRRIIENRLDGEGRGDLSGALSKCGWMELFRCACCGAGRRLPSRCKKRYCPVCAPLIADRFVLRYKSTLKLMQWPLFSSWTTMHTPLFPCPGFPAMFDALKQIRRQVWFANKVPGGIVSGEVTAGGANGWHVHLHTVIDCKWLSVVTPAPFPGADKRLVQRRAKLSRTEVTRQWEMALGRSGDVWSQRASGEEAAHEVLKYSVKGGDLVDAVDDIGPVIDLMRRVKLVRSWGTMYGHLRDAEDEKVLQACEHCGESDGVLPAGVYEARDARGVCG